MPCEVDEGLKQAGAVLIELARHQTGNTQAR